MLDIKSLGASIDGKKILDGFDLKIKPGEVHAIMGPNGSGKSTLANVLTGKNGYEIEGQVFYEGKDLLNLPIEERAQKGLFMAFQYPLEIAGVNTNNFLKTSLNTIRKVRGLKELDSLEFLKLVKTKTKNLKIDEKILNHVDRWSLQNDLFSQCVSGTKQLQEYLDFTTSYHDEDDYITLHNLAQNLYHLYKLTRKEKFSDEIRTYTVQFLGTIFDRLGWDSQKNEKHTDALLRSFVITALGKLGDKEILNEARKRFNKFLKNKNSLAADLQEPVFVLVAWQGNEKTYNKLLSLYKKSTLQEEKIRFLMAMCNFKQKNLLLKTLALSLTPEVRSQNIRVPIMGVSANIYGSDILWPWLKNNWKKLVSRFGVGNPLANRIVASIGPVINDKQEKEVRNFFKKNPMPGTERILEQTLERVRIRSKFLRRIKKEFI